MGRFIQLAVATARYATTQAAIHVTPENAERVGVYVGSGIGAFEVIEREHSKLIAQGPPRTYRKCLRRERYREVHLRYTDVARF